MMTAISDRFSRGTSSSVWQWAAAGSIASIAVLLAACPGLQQKCRSDSDCFQGEVCRSGTCVVVNPKSGDTHAGRDGPRDSSGDVDDVSGRDSERPEPPPDGSVDADAFDGGEEPVDSGSEPDGRSGRDADEDSGSDVVPESFECRPGESRPCGTTTGACSEGTQTCSSSGTWGECAGGTRPTEELCDGKDNDCDGSTDETDVLLTEDFEGKDPLGWSKVPSGHGRLNIDDDVTGGSPPQGSEYGRASYGSGTCVAVAGMGAAKKLDGEVDEIRLHANVEISAWGRAAMFVEDSDGNVTTIWTANAKGGGYDSGGWMRLVFDHNSNSSRTTSSGAVVETKAIPSDLGNETVRFIFGNNDDSSPCQNGDHLWRTAVDAVEVVDTCD